jgi:phosphoserine phosphatase RsbU/P
LDSIRRFLNLLIESNNLKNKLITDEIKNILEFQDFSFDFLEADLNKRMEFLSGRIVRRFFVGTQNIENVDLAEIQKELGMDPRKEDIYIINTKGIVVNTTFKKDLGLNFFSFGEEHKRYLQGIIAGEHFVSERFSIEKHTQQLKKYSYQPTFDKKYIVELGVYSQQATDIIEMFKHRLNEFSEKQKNIISVDFFIGAETPISFNKNTEVIKDKHRDVFLKTFKEQKSNTIVENVDGKKLHYEYAFMQRRNTALYKGAVIRIVSDRSTEDEVLRRELLTFFILFGITITSLLVLIFQKTKLITSPIKKLVENINRIKQGDLKLRAEVEGNNEIATLSEQYNLMLEQIESYYNGGDFRKEKRN